MRYFVETSVIVDYLRGKVGSANIINNLKGEITSSYVCLAELYEGIYRSRQKSKDEEAVGYFFAGLSEIFGVDEEVAKKFGEIRAGLKKAGKVIEDMDIFMASTCLAYGLILVTRNYKHFSVVEGLEIVTIPS